MNRAEMLLTDALVLAAKEHSPYSEGYPRTVLSSMILRYGLPIRGISKVLSHGVKGGTYSQPTLRRIIDGTTDPRWQFAQRIKTLDTLLKLKADQGLIDVVPEKEDGSVEYEVKISASEFFDVVHGQGSPDGDEDNMSSEKANR